MRTKLLALLVGAIVIGCSSGEDPESYAKKRADETRPKRGPSQITKFVAPVPRDKHVACDALLDAGAIGTAVNKRVELIDQWHRGMPRNAVCVAVDAKTADEQRAAATREDDAIGQTIGLEDAVCRIEAACYDPFDADTLERRCAREVPGGIATKLGAIPACLAKTSTKDRNSKLMESGRVEHVKFRLIAFEPDTTCQLTIYALDDEDRARACANAAVASITKQSIAEFD